MSTYNPILHPGFVGSAAWGGGEEGDGTDMYGHAATRPPHGREFGQFTRETPEDLVSNGLEDNIPIPPYTSEPRLGRRTLVRDIESARPHAPRGVTLLISTIVPSTQGRSFGSASHLTIERSDALHTRL